MSDLSRMHVGNIMCTFMASVARPVELARAKNDQKTFYKTKRNRPAKRQGKTRAAREILHDSRIVTKRGSIVWSLFYFFTPRAIRS